MIRKATVRDVPAIVALVNENAQKGLLLPKSLNQVYQNIRDFVVFETDGQLVGCAALHVLWEDLAEVRSVVVDEERRRKGTGPPAHRHPGQAGPRPGRAACLCPDLPAGILPEPGLSARSTRTQLPHKIWADCIDCVKFPQLRRDRGHPGSVAVDGPYQRRDMDHLDCRRIVRWFPLCMSLRPRPTPARAPSASA